ncbi:AraC family transcriptional regulator [Marivirga arenosa]|uniref:AraC family transcriptional regulator n=1 Tax=Marivirga arenosa TaxID=3059076 RepID=A0AA49GBK4_9BACT|nr:MULTISPECIES: AraC family transcriptional regulator [unclassified Marivirga]WKK78926.2 AraC family transcriptional regulator [Marivirga sp. BKB1-2]WKK86044.2 AraC family transcriptional regulator [Marivirga sp. ABR2-2]
MQFYKPTLEQIEPTFGSSVLVRKFEESKPNKDPFWHFHPEIELVYVKGGNGKRHIGNHISYYQDGDLMLIGSNLPHYGFTDRLTGNESETIIQMKEDFPGPTFLSLPEIQPIKQLIETAKLGIVFKNETKNRIGSRIESLVEKPPFERLIEVIQILKELSEVKDYYLLNSEAVSIEAKAVDQQRVNLIYDYVRDNFKKSIALEEIAKEAAMTVPAFCRYFKKISNKTFTHFVNEHRVVHASKLLSEGNLNITDICYACGFNNISHFNRQFKEVTGKSPSEYRKEIKRVVR